MSTGHDMIQRAFRLVGGWLSVYTEGYLRIFLNGLMIVA